MLGHERVSRWVLRVVNIPVEPVGVSGHTAPWFVSEDLFLRHGDDPYNALSKAGYPATYLLVSRDVYEAWFAANNTKPIAFSPKTWGGGR